MAKEQLFLQSSPHFKDQDSVPKIMYAVILSLAPAVFASFYFFRWDALILLLTCVIACLATESLFLWLRKKPLHSLWDGSALITGILLALLFPLLFLQNWLSSEPSSLLPSANKSSEGWVITSLIRLWWDAPSSKPPFRWP